MPPIDVAAALVFRQGKLLITQRHPDAHLGGLWEFPGGKREADESLIACLQRELDEELGIAADVGDLLWHQVHCYPDGQPFELFFYLVPSYLGTPVNRAFAEIRWVRVGALTALDFLDADRQLVSRLDRGQWSPGEPR